MGSDNFKAGAEGRTGQTVYERWRLYERTFFHQLLIQGRSGACISKVDVLAGDDFFPEQPFQSRIVKLIKKQSKPSTEAV